MIDGVPDLEMVESHYFYISLFVTCYLQVCMKMQIDKNRKVTSHWKYSEKSFVTPNIAWILNVDFAMNRMFCKIELRLPGLSLLVVCRKV